MNRLLKVICLAGTFGLLTPSLMAQGEIRSELEKRTIEVRGKVHDLFDQRDNPIEPMDADLNPFYRVAGFEPAPPPEVTEDAPIFVPPPRKEAELLEAIAASLKINGIVTYNDRDLIVINQSPTPAGRMLTVEFEEKTYFLRVEEIYSNRVVLSLGSAFTILPIAIEKEPTAGAITPSPRP